VKRLLAVVVVIAIAAFAVWIVATQQQPTGTTPDAVEMIVVDVTDGDTLRLRGATGAVENVRLIGIDTPEVYPEYECFGDEAEAELLRLAPIGSTLQAAPDADPFDDYDRLLLYLWNGDGVFVNLALVEGGFAEAIRVAPNDRHFDELRAAEDAAARAGLGMWGAC
jgi:micrococcal nuclease